MRVLVAEDEPDMNHLIVRKLKKDGYAVDACYDGEEAWEYIQYTKYDVIILDVMMPRCDGITLVKKMRDNKINTSVLFLTARDSIEDRVLGLDSGANDYLVKPFSFKELAARLRVLTREVDKIQGTGIYVIHDLELDTIKHEVKRAGLKIELSAKEFAVLEYLIRNQGSVMTRESIENNVWDYDYDGASNMVDVYIRYLRKKIDDGFEKKLIHTVRSVGYVLKEEDS